MSVCMRMRVFLGVPYAYMLSSVCLSLWCASSVGKHITRILARACGAHIVTCQYACSRARAWIKAPVYNPVPPCSKLGVCELSSIDELLWSLPWITISRPTLNCWGCGETKLSRGLLFRSICFCNVAHFCVSAFRACVVAGVSWVSVGRRSVVVTCSLVHVCMNLKGLLFRTTRSRVFEQVVNWQGFVSKCVAPCSTIVSFCACDGSAFDTHGA